MSVQTDLTRIKNAKAAIKAAIEGKGVTVPDGTLLDGMAALIESIEAGVNVDFSPFEEVAWGTFVPSEDTGKINLVDLCARFPTTISRYTNYIVALYCYSTTNNPQYKVCTAFSTRYDGVTIPALSFLNSAGSSNPTKTTSQPSIIDGIMSVGSFKFVAGQKYRYIIGA